MKRYTGRGGLRAMMAGGAALLLLATGAQADVITYNNGKVIKGLITETPGESESVTFVNETGKIRIPRTRIKDIAKESKAQGYLEIGAAHMLRQEYNEALRAFQQAATLEPDNAEAKKNLDAAQAKIGDQQRLSRTDALGKIDKRGDEARQLIKQGEFTKAEDILKEADKLVPNDGQRKKLRELISELYLAWADERQDKLDPKGAEDKLNLALAANTNNEQVVERMLKLWERNPQKREQTANIYETILERHPEDRVLRKKLGDIYFDMNRWEDAAHHYLELYKSSDEYKGTQLEERLADCLNRLHAAYARKKDYDKAIRYYELLAAIDKDVNPTDVIYYQFLKREKELGPKDMKGRLVLAKFAEQNGMDEQALKFYRQLVPASETRAEAQAGLDRYAIKALSAAQAQFQTGNYTLAQALADQVRTDYPNSAAVVERASELAGRAQAEQVKDRRQRRELARDVVQRADEFYQQARASYNNLFSIERRNMPVLVSDRTNAKRYFTLALNAYQEALRIDPTLGTESASLVSVRINECRGLLARLNQGPSNMPQNFGRPLLSR